jgi:hypothetical protein
VVVAGSGEGDALAGGAVHGGAEHRAPCPCVWLESSESGAEPTLVLGTAPTLPKFGWKCWVGVAPTLFFVWLEE